MKTKFCFVRCADKWSPDVVIFAVYVGSSRRELVKCQLVDCYASDCNFFFRRWDDDTDFWLIQHAKEVFPDSHFPLCRFRTVSIGIMEFYRMIIDDSIDSYERKATFPNGHFRLMTLIDPHILPPPSIDSVLHLPFRPKRKNLKSMLEDEKARAAISFALILLLIVLDAIVSNLIGY